MQERRGQERVSTGMIPPRPDRPPAPPPPPRGWPVRPQGQPGASCPAATGEPAPGNPGCPHFPDGAHRCGRDRQPMNVEHASHHRCTCGVEWRCDDSEWRGLRAMGTARFRGETK